MSRLLFLIAIVFLVYLLVRAFRKNAPRQDKPVVDDMVQCAQCGVHVPKGDSVQENGKFFCCTEHRDAYRK